MTSYSLTVVIEDDAIFSALAQGGYNLCIAKKVNDVYNVVWSGTSFLQFNAFAWTENYQVFGGDISNQFGNTIKASTKSQEIKFGQRCTMNAEGVLQPATGIPDNSGTFQFDNQYGTIRAGVNCNFQGRYLPIYISKTLVEGVDELSPTNTMLVWFDNRYRTGFLVENITSITIEVDLTAFNDQTVIYTSDEKWTIRDTNDMPQLFGSAKSFGGQEIGPDLHPSNDIVQKDLHDTSPTEFVTEIHLTFSTAQDATSAWNYFKDKTIPNLVQELDPPVDDLSFKLKLGWDKMKGMMDAEDDESKIRNAFALELSGLEHQPSSFSVVDLKREA